MTSRGPYVFPSPFETPASAGTRFLMEMVAWVAGPWAAAELAGNGWVAIPALIVLVGLPSVFNTPGDKNATGVAIPGPLRIGLEMFLIAVAVGASWIVWPIWLAILVTVLAVATIVAGRPRYRWLAAGAPPVDGAG